MTIIKDNILITGGSGLLALNWAVTMRDSFSVILGMHNRHIKLDGVDCIAANFDSVNDITSFLGNNQPKLVIHTAGLTSVEACERNPVLAKEINVGLTVNVAKAAKQLGIKFVHISTDHLFDGTKSNISEDEPIVPVNEYGRTKGEAEEAVLQAHNGALVVRTNFYGWGPSYRPSFSDTIINNLRQGNTITLFDDVFYTPILAYDLVHTIHKLADRNAIGIFNVVGNERISKYQFGIEVARKFSLDSDLIISGSIRDNPNLVRRPVDMSLSNKKACDFLNEKIRPINEQIDYLYNQEYSQSVGEIKNA